MKQKQSREQLPLSDKILFNDVDFKSWFKNRAVIKAWIKSTILNEGKRLGLLSFNFCSDETLLRINIKYLQHNFYTDIITFELSDSNQVSGDIYISLERVKENAKTNKTSYNKELMRVLIHGVLHLCGYKDKSKKEATLMREKEDHYLSLL